MDRRFRIPRQDHQAWRKRQRSSRHIPRLQAPVSIFDKKVRARTLVIGCKRKATLSDFASPIPGADTLIGLHHLLPAFFAVSSISAEGVQGLLFQKVPT